MRLGAGVPRSVTAGSFTRVSCVFSGRASGRLAHPLPNLCSTRESPKRQNKKNKNNSRVGWSGFWWDASLTTCSRDSDHLFSSAARRVITRYFDIPSCPLAFVRPNRLKITAYAFVPIMATIASGSPGKKRIEDLLVQRKETCFFFFRSSFFCCFFFLSPFRPTDLELLIQPARTVVQGFGGLTGRMGCMRRSMCGT